MDLPHQIEAEIEGLQDRSRQIRTGNRRVLLEQQVSELRTRRNGLASLLCSLPPELPSHILHICVLTNHLLYPISDVYLLYNITRTCKHVHLMVLDSPVLWSYVLLDREAKRIRVGLTRAGSTLLSVA